MDDLCITISADTAHGVESKTSIAASVLLETCMSHGVTPNLDKGKSEILFTFRGKGSRSLRLKYFGQASVNTMPVLTEYGSHAVSVVGHYVHLGNVAHHSGISHKEVRRRLALGNAAFSAHRKLLFQNPAFASDRRCELFCTLVMSKISYGMESWLFEDKKTGAYFHSALVRLYRRLLKVPPDSNLADEEILARANLPSPDVALRIARLCYVGLLYRCDGVTPWALLRADTDWVHMIQQDLQWLWDLVACTSNLPDPIQHFGAWEYILRYHRGYWKTLLQKALRLTLLRQQDHLRL